MNPFPFNANLLAGFPNEKLLKTKEKIGELEKTIALQDIRIQSLEDQLTLSQFHVPKITELRAFTVLKKMDSTPRRFAGMSLINGRVYLESTEITDFLRSQEVPEKIRYEKGKGNLSKITLDVMNLIVNTFPDSYYMEPEGNKKKIWVLVQRD